MSDWDNLNKGGSIPRNDPNIKRDRSFDDAKNNVGDILDAGLRTARIAQQGARILQEPRSRKERQRMVKQLLTNSKTSSHTTRSRATTRPLNIRTASGEKINDTALTVLNIVLYLGALTVVSPIFSRIGGVTSVALYIATWFLVRNFAKSIMEKFK